MAVKASATINVFRVVEVSSTTIYYLLQSSTANPPAKPTSDTPGGNWTTTEPSYTEGSTNTLYTVTKTKYSDNTFEYTPVSKSTSYEAAKSAYNKAVNAQSTADAIPEYIASRGENLITNGTALLKNNYNFSSLTYDGSDTYYAGGCFKWYGKQKNPQNNEFIPVDVSDTYELSYYIKCDTENIRHYDWITMYDIDKLEIGDGQVMYVPGSTTTLSQDLKNGDTVVYLTSVAGFKTYNGNYSRKLIFWDYTNSYGYTYLPETYSRNVYGSYGDPLWVSETESIDYTNNTITLKKAWTHGTKIAGTPVSQGNNGSSYRYGNANFALTPNTWTKKTTKISGITKNNGGQFREGTAFVKLGWFLNYRSSVNATTKLSTISFTRSPGLKTTITQVDVQYYLSTSSSTPTGGSWSTTAPAWVNGKYMWSRQKITYGNGTSTTRNETCIAGAKGETGSKGDTGKGISTVTEQFYLSTSDETPTGGNWVDTPPTLTNDTYMWTRSKISYTDNTVSYTEPSCASSWNNIFISNNAPTDTSKLWFNTSDNLFYEYKNGEWELVIDLDALSNTFDSKIEDAKDYANTIKSAIDKDLADYYYKKTEVKKEVEDGITESLTKWRTIATEEASNGNTAFTKITELESYIKKGVDTSGLPYIELGTGDPTGYSLRIQNDSIAIFQGSSEIPVSEWLSDKFNVATVITSALGIGNFDFIVNDDDSVSFRKVR